MTQSFGSVARGGAHSSPNAVSRISTPVTTIISAPTPSHRLVCDVPTKFRINVRRTPFTRRRYCEKSQEEARQRKSQRGNRNIASDPTDSRYIAQPGKHGTDCEQYQKRL